MHSLLEVPLVKAFIHWECSGVPIGTQFQYINLQCFRGKYHINPLEVCVWGDGRPSNQRTGRRHTNRSSICRSDTFNDRMPPPIGVVRGPLIATLYCLIALIVFAGSHVPTASKAALSSLEDFPFDLSRPSIGAANRSIGDLLSRIHYFSGPIPSPGMKGMVLIVGDVFMGSFLMFQIGLF